MTTAHPEWDARFMRLCREVASWSKDRSRKVGAVIVDRSARVIQSTGYNGFPRGADDDVEDRHARPTKYLWTEHAERNAIYNAGRTGAILQGSTMYCLLYPCVDCARGIVQAGITRLVTPVVDWEDPAPWFANWRVVRAMLKECGVQHDEIPDVEAPRYMVEISTIGPSIVESIGTPEWHKAITDAVEQAQHNSTLLRERGVIE